MEHREKTFKNQKVVLDGNTFTGCSFRGCTLIFNGVEGFTFSANSLDDLRVEFGGAAALTLKTLKDFYHGFGEGGKRLVEKTFDEIRRKP